MEKLVFLKEATDALNLALEAIQTKAHLKGMEDLNTTVIAFDAIVKELSGGKLGIALIPSLKQTHPQLPQHRFYILGVVDDTRKKLLLKLDLLAAPISGEYPVFVFSEDAQPFPIPEKMGVEARFIQHCCGGPLPNLVHSTLLLEAQKR
jgi:hypothetical protein